MRLAMGHITKTLFEIANFVYLAGGTTALRTGPIERMVRTFMPVAAITSAPNTWRNCGRELAGLAGGTHWILMNLVPDES